MPSRRSITPASPFSRLTAVMVAMLVFLLGLAAQSPQLHALLHTGAGARHLTAQADTPADSELSCAVSLLSHSTDCPVQPVQIAEPMPDSLTTLSALDQEIPLAPDYLHRPSRGPPAA